MRRRSVLTVALMGLLSGCGVSSSKTVETSTSAKPGFAAHANVFDACTVAGGKLSEDRERCECGAEPISLNPAYGEVPSSEELFAQCFQELNPGRPMPDPPVKDPGPTSPEKDPGIVNPPAKDPGIVNSPAKDPGIVNPPAKDPGPIDL